MVWPEPITGLPKAVVPEVPAAQAVVRAAEQREREALAGVVRNKRIAAARVPIAPADLGMQSLPISVAEVQDTPE